MSAHSEGDWTALRRQVLGLGEGSLRKSHYSSLRQRLSELQRFRNVLDVSRDLLLIVELPAGRILDANQAAQDSLGEGSIVGHALADCLPAEFVTEVLDLAAAFARGDSDQANLHLLLPAGDDHKRFDAAVRCGSDSEGSYAFIAARDVTRQWLAQQDLETSEARFRALYDTMSDAVVVHDAASGLVVDVNRRSCEMYGRNYRDFLGLDIGHLSGGDPQAALDRSKPLMSAAAEGRPQLFEWQARRADGSLFWVEVHLTPAEIGGSQLILALVRDISERKAIEERSLQSQKLESLGRLAGGVAHDFNNILTVINGYAELLATLSPSASELAAGLGHIRSAGERATALVQQLLAFSRRQRVEFATLNLNDSVREVLSMLRPLIGEAIELREELSAGPLPISADANQLHQVLVNLAVNARDAMAREGRLTVRTRRLSIPAAATAPCPGMPAGDYAMLEVEDTGAGIPASIAPHIFDPFFTTKAPGRGTGLGLPTVFGIVTRSRGFVWFDSRLGSGTTFYIALPLLAGSPLETTPGSADAAVQRGEGTVLVVEDERDVRALAAEVLSQAGYRVLTASSAEEALQLAAQTAVPIDLLLTDVVMPGMDGRQLARTLAAGRSGMRVLLTSGYCAEVERHEETGPTGGEFLQKPYLPSELTARVRAMLPPAAPRSSTAGAGSASPAANLTPRQS